MNGLKLFLAYATAFESTVQDDDWDRIKPYFSPDAVYEVESGIVGARMIGPDAICAGIRRSLGGFDRRFASRRLEPLGMPEQLEDGCRIEWKAHYEQPGVEPLTIRGASTARFRDGKIVLLADRFEASDEEAFLAWQRRNPGFPVDLSYVG
ncbi:nuclear transport factor 2 family protein [Myxococcota bacterium]|nr:nuclear transport factor 2 family protein [Myxococcota bacterium]